jgi:hypothetical protein
VVLQSVLLPEGRGHTFSGGTPGGADMSTKTGGRWGGNGLPAWESSGGGLSSGMSCSWVISAQASPFPRREAGLVKKGPGRRAVAGSLIFYVCAISRPPVRRFLSPPVPLRL